MLVIIGLLIGGILVARSMISTAKVQSIISEGNQYLIAARNYKTKYSYFPGDTNHNGIIEHNCGGCSEGVNFFTSLATTELLSLGLQQGTDERYAVVGTNVPRGKEKNTHFMVEYFSVDNTTYLATANNEIFTSPNVGLNSSFLFYSGDCSTMAGASDDYKECAFLKGADALAIDKKIDDGMPNTGNFIGNEDWTRSNIMPD